MTITQLKYVLALAEYGSFTEAAEYCKVKQPSLSTQIQKLEEELKAKIFNRSKKPIQLTPIGVKIVEQAKLIVDESSRILDIVEQQKGYVGGDFKLGVLPTIMPTLLPLFMHHFTLNYPKVKLLIEELSIDEIISKLSDGHIDAALASTPLQNEAIKERVLYYEPIVAVVSNHHALRNKEKITVKNIAVEELILSNENSSFRNVSSNLMEVYKSNINQFKIKTNNLDALVGMAIQGIGVTLVPFLHTLNFKEEMQSNFKGFESPVPAREVSLLYHKSQLKIQMIEALKSSIDTVIRGKIPFGEVDIISPLSKF